MSSPTNRPASARPPRGPTGRRSRRSVSAHRYSGNMSAAAPDARLLRAAYDAAARGFWVFPLAPHSKKPAFAKKNWHEIATRDTTTIVDLWGKTPYNIGIDCELSGLHVLDLDNSHGQQPPPQWRGARDGRDVLARLAAAAGKPFPGPTYRVQSPSGGWHLYFRSPSTPTLRNTSGTLGWRIDTRGTGGYIVGAGSILPNGTYRIRDTRDPTELPSWLVTALAPPPPRPPRAINIQASASRYALTALQRQTQRIQEAPPGTRHATLISAASSIGRLVGAGMLSRSHAHHALRAAADAHIGRNGFTDTEADSTINDGLDWGIARPTTVHLRH